jgi:ubiquinone biosynthesis protein
MAAGHREHDRDDDASSRAAGQRRKQHKGELRRRAVRDAVDAEIARWREHGSSPGSSREGAATVVVAPSADRADLALIRGPRRSPAASTELVVQRSPGAGAPAQPREPHRREDPDHLPGPGKPHSVWGRMANTVRRRKPVDPRYSEHIQRSLPRRKSLISPHDRTTAPSMMRKVVIKVTRRYTFTRLVVWGMAIARFVIGNAIDWILRRGNRERSAERLRKAFEQMGGSVVKIGQQLGMRIDLLPYEYTNQLSRMLDKVPPFKSRHAFDAILRTMHRKDPSRDWRLEDIFESFDPEPIGSASVSCVYQAVLKHNGEKVAVKVRRPGIGPVFVADCAALSWILRLLEVLTIIRPGLSKNLVVEFRNMLLDELDFAKEARNAELFRRGLRRGKLDHADAPKVHFDYSSDEVLVYEFVHGIWLNEVLSAVERKDETLLALLDRLNIKPELVAKRLLGVNQYGIFENLLFHADPHPANVVVRPNSEVVFIDFGACGSYTHRERYVWRQLLLAQHNQDISQMVACALAVLEPLPAIDLDEFTKRLENVFWQDLYAFKSKHSEWWERTSARIWLSFLELSREFAIPMNLNTLRMIRSTLLYDTIAARLYPRISVYKEHHKYNERAGKRARKRYKRELHRLVTRGPRPSFYLRVEQIADMANRVLYFAQRFLDAPPLQFASMLAKSVFVALVVLRMVGLILAGAGGLWMYYLYFADFCGTAPALDASSEAWGSYLDCVLTSGVPPGETRFGLSFHAMIENHWLLLYIVVIVVFHVRRLSFRLHDTEND